MAAIGEGSGEEAVIELLQLNFYTSVDFIGSVTI
jgi:hypothetical protein